MGLERTICVLNETKSVYDIGCLKEVINFINLNAEKSYDYDEKAKRYYRIITDHIRSSVFILGDVRGVVPSNVGQGYILRRFLRRAINCARYIGLDCAKLVDIADMYVDKYGKYYNDIAQKREFIKTEILKEIDKFSKALEEGYREFEKVIKGIEKHKEFASKTGEVVENKLSGKAVFRLYDTFGFPFELTRELAKERGYEVDEEDYQEKFKEHQEISRQAAAGTFKGGLADSSKQSAYLHTATHLLLAALQHKYGKDVKQRGSNITPERLRFDFNLDHKMTKEELEEIENFVNNAIQREIPVVCEVVSLEDAKNSGAEGIFTNKYGEEVKVYTIGDVSKEICGGPHASNTRDLHHFKIIKEESSSSGIRRIKAILD